jgi:di/tricarboxylate transporter
VEALVLPRPGLQGRTLKQTRFHEKYGVIVLGLRRHGNIFFRKMSQVSLATGDLLLLRGATQDLRSLEDEGFLKLLYEADRPKNSLRRGLVAGAIFVISLSLGIAKIITLPMAALLGAFLMLATKCASPRETFREMEWKAVILIACMLSVGTALTTSRADQAIGSAIITWGGSLPAIVLMGGVFVLTVALSQPMSNQAAAALILPVAVQIAVQLGLDPRPFAITVALAASCSFLTPLEPACLLVYGPGGYRFKDFFIVGFPLTLLMLAITLWLVPKWWPLTV